MTGEGPGNGLAPEGQPPVHVRTIGGLGVRAAAAEDAADLARLGRETGLAESGLPGTANSGDAADLARAVQTGQAIWLAQRGLQVVAMVRHGDDDGIAWFDGLASVSAGAGWTLVRVVEMAAQDRGLRLVRCRAPEDSALEDYFGWLGYLPVAREGSPGGPLLVLERRLPLLTVREQRREDAAIIAALTGRDSYQFELGHRPGWFVVADGDRVAGVAWVADGGAGVGRIEPPVLVERYRGRRLEPWILDRLAYHAEHAGYHTVAATRDEWLDDARRELEERGWQRDGGDFVRRLSAPPTAEPDW